MPATYKPNSGALLSPESIFKPKTPSQESPYPWLPTPSYYRTYSTEIDQQFEPASKPCLNLINPEIGQSPEYELNNPSISIKELFKDRIDYLVPKVLPTKYYDDNFNDPDLNKRDLKSIDLGDVAVAKYEPKDKILLKTDNPNIDLVAWRSKVKMLNAKLVFNVKDVSAVNFMPIIGNR
ncbi:unnamed protein product [Colias eurytheme]|nr:unnamed protein product [Colias eurytheme]